MECEVPVSERFCAVLAWTQKVVINRRKLICNHASASLLAILSPVTWLFVCPLKRCFFVGLFVVVFFLKHPEVVRYKNVEPRGETVPMCPNNFRSFSLIMKKSDWRKREKKLLNAEKLICSVCVFFFFYDVDDDDDDDACIRAHIQHIRFYSLFCIWQLYSCFLSVITDSFGKLFFSTHGFLGKKKKTH